MSSILPFFDTRTKEDDMLIGYARVSTEDQKLDLQRDALHAAGCTRLFDEKVSGAASSLPARDEPLRFARPDDVVVVWRLDRAPRCTGAYAVGSDRIGAAGRGPRG